MVFRLKSIYCVRARAHLGVCEHIYVYGHMCRCASLSCRRQRYQHKHTHTLTDERKEVAVWMVDSEQCAACAYDVDDV